MASLINASFPGIRLEKSYSGTCDTLTDLTNEGTHPVIKDDASIKMMVTSEEKSKTYNLFLINGSQSLATDNQGIQWSEAFINKHGDLIIDLGHKI